MITTPFFRPDMTRERLERAVYQFFHETRMYEGKEFFQPLDSRGRPMVPVYHALLTLLTSSDIRAIRRFYLQHGTTALAARQWIESQHELRGGPGAVARPTGQEAAELKNKLILAPAAVEALNRVEQHLASVENAPLQSDDDDGHSVSSADEGKSVVDDHCARLWLCYRARNDAAVMRTVYGSLCTFSRTEHDCVDTYPNTLPCAMN
jgi:hypothetical protein